MRRDKVNKVLFFCCYALLTAFNSIGQSSHIEFDHYTTKDGLSNGYINSFLQDSEGFIWIGTSNGLNRFDGINFKTYYFNSKDTTSVPGSVVTTVVEDSEHTLWVMTSNGLCTYDRQQDCFSRKSILVNGKRLKDYYLYTSIEDSKGYLWVSAANNGIFRFKIDHSLLLKRFINAELYDLQEEDVEEVYRKNVFSIIEDTEGKIWVASFSNQLFYLDRSQNKFIAQPILQGEAAKFSNKRKGLFNDRDDDFFVTIEDNGLLEWDRKTDHFSLYKPDGPVAGPKGKVLFALGEDKDGTIWIGDRNSEGISFFNKKTSEFTYSQSDPWNPYSLITNKINCFYRDNTGAMWVGTIIGINKFSPGKSKFNRYYSNSNQPDKLNLNNTLCFEEGKNGIVWIGTDGGGLNKLNRKTDKFSYFMHDPANPNTLSSNSVISICEDQQGTLWMGTFHGGLSRMKDGKFKTYLPDATNPYSISNRNIWYVHEDSRQNLWLATLSSGLDLFDRKSERFYHFTHDAGDSTSLCNNSLYGIYEDSRHDLYVTSNYGVSIIDLKAYDFSKAPTKLKFRNLLHVNNKNSLSSSNVYCVREDNEGNLWFGTMGSGIDLLDVSTGKFTNYSTNDGLPGNSITSILVDSENYLWLATDKGLAKFDPRTKEVVVFDPKDGLQNMGFKSWAIQTKDGEMFFGGPDGFNSFYPEKIKKNINHNIAPVVITGLKIFNNPVEINQRFHQRILLPTAISKTSELVLTHSENFFTFEFIALDYTTPGKNQYAYKMEGFDKEWVQCGTKREANYTNLDPGEYTFRVKAANNDGVWNENGTSLKVIILPNWWQTWWFRLILAFGVICIFLTIYYSRIRQFKNQQILLEKLVLQKTSELRQMNSMLIKQAEELNQTNTLLEVRQGQIEEQSEELSAQKESLVEMNNELHDLNATKDKFFSIIAHDIKNPFNAILGFTNLLEQNFSEWTDEMKLEIISLVHSSSKNLYQLLDNLLQWSRSQRGIIEFNPEKTALKELLYKVIELMNGTAEAKNIELKVILPENELIILADRQMLDTILRNLIGNALKFTHTEGMVQVTAEAKDGFVLIKVADNGVGMSNEIKEKLFRIDVNYSSPGTQNEIGTGLGLILVKEFVEKHGGMIGVDSIEGKGSTFYFTLPLSKM
ncbi:MAG TPA: two-component regulator propeller domain-containing protein [Prolixibacteraceae bacterium]